jgi:hypothetical protein
MAVHGEEISEAYTALYQKCGSTCAGFVQPDVIINLLNGNDYDVFCETTDTTGDKHSTRKSDTKTCQNPPGMLKEKSYRPSLWAPKNMEATG